MQEKSKIILKWKLIPSDFLNGYEDQLFSFFQAKVEDGEITITRETSDVLDPSTERDQVQEKLNNFLMSVSLLHRKVSFSLIPTGLDIVSEGARYLNAEVGIYAQSGMEIDITITNKDGRIDVDTKKERMSRQQELFDLISDNGTDPIVVKILESYKNALDHDEKLLVYLYEIRDTLSNYFGNDETAKQMLNISSRKWSRFGTLANDHSINQSRHYLEVTPNSREITEKERNSAFSFAQTMIESFLYYLKQYGNK